jgi:hypothetical protein
MPFHYDVLKINEAMNIKHFIKRTIYLVPFLAGMNLILLLFLSSCENNNDPGDPSQPLIFSSLDAERDTILPGETTKITAVASGYRITYNWSASAGDILNSGAEVIYAASPCQAGRNSITCTVKDGNEQSETKEIFIVVE